MRYNKKYQQQIEFSQKILKQERIGSHNYQSLLLMIVVLFGFKPVSSFGANQKSLKKMIKYINDFGLLYKKFPANPQGYYEIVVSKHKKDIIKYEFIDRISAKQQLKKEKLLGKIYGYPNSAIQSMIKSLKDYQPVQFWVDVNKDKQIPPELIIANIVIDFVPAAIDDKDSKKLGQKTIKLFDQINPKISKYYIKTGQKSLPSTAKEMLKYYH